MRRLSFIPLVLILMSMGFLSCSKSTEPDNNTAPYFSQSGLSMSDWRDISYPLSTINIADVQQQMKYKARTYWYNITPSDILLQEIKDSLPQAYVNQAVKALDVVFDPSVRGAYNYTADLSKKSQNWGGMVRPLGSDEFSANGYPNGTAKFIRMWINPVSVPAGQNLYIDIGQCSEEVIPNGRLDSEDKNYDDLLELNEDTGIDGVIDSLEPGYSKSNPDPSGDDMVFDNTGLDYSQINGTEHNAPQWTHKPDSEDLNGNQSLDILNICFRYTVPLDADPSLNKYIVEKGKSGWIKLKIPLGDYSAMTGDASLNRLENIRLWFRGPESRIHIRIAELTLTDK